MSFSNIHVFIGNPCIEQIRKWLEIQQLEAALGVSWCGRDDDHRFATMLALSQVLELFGVLTCTYKH